MEITPKTSRHPSGTSWKLLGTCRSRARGHMSCIHPHTLFLHPPRRMHYTRRRNVPHIRALIGHALWQLVVRTRIRTPFATFTLRFRLPSIILVPTQVRLRRASALLDHLVRLRRLSVARWNCCSSKASPRRGKLRPSAVRGSLPERLRTDSSMAPGWGWYASAFLSSGPPVPE
jgi:hypothetical protein